MSRGLGDVYKRQSVFSQLERETIAERIRDNMHELAKTGRWLGGTTPTGYASESVKSITVDGKTKKACKLKLLPDEAAIIYKIFDLYEQYDSLTMTETELLRQGIKKKNRAFVHPVFHQVDFAESCLPGCRQGRLSVFCGQ